MLKTFRNMAASTVIAGIAATGFMTTGASAEVPESKDPLKIVIMGYSGDNIIMYIYGELIQKLGYNVEYTPADYIGQFAGVGEGDLHIASPGWDTTAKDVMAKAFGSGKVLNMGNIGIAVNEDWWYPLYVKDHCPGLPDWKALMEPDCVKALSTPETEPKARFLSGPIEWGGTDPQRIDAMGLDFEVVNAGSDGALAADLVAAIKRKQPIVAWSWEPYWIPALYPGEFVEWPEYDDACYTDATWGMNAEKTHDCGRPGGHMWKAAWVGGDEIWPKAYDVWRKFQLDAETAGKLVYQSDVEGVDTKDVAKQWVAENKAIWKAWVE